MASASDSGIADVFVRIRPENEKEKKYKAKGKEKFLEDYDEGSLTIDGRKGKTSRRVYDFPKLVLGPTCSQEEAYVSLGLDKLLDKFLFHNEDVSLLAYGQTGSGKTHTMFGDGLTRQEIRRVLARDPGEDDGGEGVERCPGGWGIFPRTVLSALDKIRRPEKLQTAADSSYKVVSWRLSASVIEMYFGEIKDLLDAKRVIPVGWTSNKDFDYNVTKQMPVKSEEDLKKLIEVVFTERQSRGTLMNESSSRSHCLTTLFLSRVLEDTTGKKFVSQTMMQFVDLSGSERTVKTGLSGTDQIKGTMTGMEGIMINIDLWALGYAVDVRKSMKNRRGKLSDGQKTGSRMRQWAFPSFLCNLLSRTINGETNCVVILCISPSPYNGAETAFTTGWPHFKSLSYLGKGSKISL